LVKPLSEAGLTYLRISNDTFHYGERTDNPASIVHSVAQKLGIDTSPICIEPPAIVSHDSGEGNRGQPVVGGGATFRGRAADKLAKELGVGPEAGYVDECHMC